MQKIVEELFFNPASPIPLVEWIERFYVVLTGTQYRIKKKVVVEQSDKKKKELLFEKNDEEKFKIKRS